MRVEGTPLYLSPFDLVQSGLVQVEPFQLYSCRYWSLMVNELPSRQAVGAAAGAGADRVLGRRQTIFEQAADATRPPAAHVAMGAG